MKKKAIVIGSGIAGLAIAIRLAIKGIEVDVFEKNTYPGGKLTEIKSNGFRFDAGPSLFTLPEQVDELFHLAGENPRTFFNYEKLKIICNYFYEDGTQLSAFADKNMFAKEVQEKLGVSTQTVLKYLDKSKFIYETTFPVFLNHSLHKLSNYLNLNFLKGLVSIPFLGIFDTIHHKNQQMLGNEKLTQLFDRYATYNGSNPFQAPAVLNAIPHLEFNIGAYFPQGGMHSITRTLYDLALRKGVNFHFNAPVEEIVVENKKTIGVISNGAQHFADLVISNSDIVPTYRKLLPKQKSPEKILSQPRSSSALIFYWGINRQFPALDMHNIFFSKDYKKEFDAIFKHDTIDDDPTIYINITTKHNPSDAPANCENWFVMINVPGNKGQNWDVLKQKAKQQILAKLNRMLDVNISALIVTEEILEPISIASKTSSYQGSLYGSSSNNRYAAFLRHANFSSKIKGLYFCGGSVHPGGGIPLCLLSAKITAEMIEG